MNPQLRVKSPQELACGALGLVAIYPFLLTSRERARGCLYNNCSRADIQLIQYGDGSIIDIVSGNRTPSALHVFDKNRGFTIAPERS